MCSMGRVEDGSRKKSRKAGLKRAILQTVAAAGLISLAIMAPNTPKIIPKEWLANIFSRSRNTRNAAVSKLIAQGMLAREKQDGVSVLRITSRGIRYLSEEQRRHLVQKPTRWDGKWRLVTFDIKEPRRKIRDALRRELQAVGFRKLQDSVWVYPYPCEEYVALLKADLHVGKDILYVIADELENDRVLREEFGIR